MKMRFLSCFIALYVGSLAGTVAALNVGGSVGVGLEHSDNIERAHIDEQSDTERNVNVGIVADHAGDRIQAALDYNISHIDYQQNVYDDETATNGSALLNFELVENVLNWKVANSTDYSQIDSAGEDTQDNRTNRNMFSTGPELLMPLGRVDLVTARALYQDVTFDNDVESDSERINAALDWAHFLADKRKLSLGVTRDEVDFDERLQTDYDKDRYYVGFSSEEGYLTYDVLLGKDKIKPDIGEDTDGSFREVGLAYSNSGHRFAFDHNNELTDSSVGLSLYEAFRASGIDPETVNIIGADGREVDSGDINFELAEVVERTRNQFSYSSPDYSGWKFAAVIYSDEQDYESALQDEESRGYDLAVSYQLLESLRLTLGYYREKTEFNDEPLLGEDDEDELRFGATYDLARAWTVSAWLARTEQSNDTDQTREYDENRAAIGLRYSFD